MPEIKFAEAVSAKKTRPTEAAVLVASTVAKTALDLPVADSKRGLCKIFFFDSNNAMHSPALIISVL